MAALAGFDLGMVGSLPPAAFASITMDGNEYVRCSKCGYGGCDVRISGCGCTLHTRCLALLPSGSLQICPQCVKPTHGLSLFPMSFREIDDAQKAAAAPRPKKRVKRADGSAAPESSGPFVAGRRTGRWTPEEMAYCDKLIAKFQTGELPVTDGIKLNEFLGSMLKSKQSRLTKKMKNAKLSSKSFQRTSGFLEHEEAREFSDLEEAFFQAITDPMERAEIKFHMQKEWRELFSRVCSNIGQVLDVDAWLSSVEEMDRRASQARDAARIAQRLKMMGRALRTDTQNPDAGVFIERAQREATGDQDLEDELLAILAEDKSPNAIDVNGKSSLLHSAPFLSKAISYLQRHMVPFEHMDLWVPSFVNGSVDDQNSCRLCYAGSATVETIVEQDGAKTRAMSPEEQFNLFAFGDYSQKFSFDVGCGLPGRVYQTGRPTWEQSVHNAPHHHFERCGGAVQWGIKTVVGVPIASPNVGRIVVTLYSIFDRQKDEDLVVRLSEEFTRLLPSPKWKLVVDIGDVEETVSVPIASAASSAGMGLSSHGLDTSRFEDIKEEHIPHPSNVASAEAAPHDEPSLQNVPSVATAPAAASAQMSVDARDPRIDVVVALLGEFMPSDPASPLSPFLSGFMSLRLLLLRPSRNADDEDLVRTMLESYSSYTAGGRSRSDIAVMLARDFMFLSQQKQPAQEQHVHHQAHQQPSMLSIENPMMQGSSHPMGSQSSTTGLSLFGLPSTSSSLQNSPALAPIPLPGSHDSMSIVSN